ncbi:hypothetical protein HDK77DRAFT_440043 [Phyllosticta capitalensis]
MDVVGCWLVDVGCWMLDVGCWMLDVGCWMLVLVVMSVSVCGCMLRLDRRAGEARRRKRASKYCLLGLKIFLAFR